MGLPGALAGVAGVRTLAAALGLRAMFAPLGTVPACPADSIAVHDFFDRHRAALPRSLVTGRGALVVVCGDSIVFSEGYGRTAAGDPVDPARTIFRAASNSKLIAATAVMQLVDEGKWSLDDDVNRYLSPSARLASLSNAGPVTLAHLLTHTAGFENKFAGEIVVPADRLTLAEFFRSHTPRRVRPPGEEVSYSNIGMALAGYLVELRSGEPFARYAERHIFAPLGMTRSSFDQPPPAAWARDLAGGLPRGRYDVVFNPYPAASLVTTPIDMGRFLAAHLAETDDSPALGDVLSPAAVARMHDTHWRAQPDAPGVAYGFFEGTINGHRILYHTGDSGDHSLVLLVPGARLGLYFVFSGSDEQTEARDRLSREFMDAFFSREPERPRSAIAGLAIPPSALAGTYRIAAYSRSNYEKARALFMQVTVRPTEQGGIRVMPPGASQPVELRRVGALTFARDSGEVVAFRESAAGAVTGFTLEGLIWDPSSWDRIEWWQDGRLHLAALGIAIGLLLLRLAWIPGAWVTRRVRAAPSTPLTAHARMLWRWSGGVAVAVTVCPFVGAATAFLSFSHPLRAIPRAIAVLTTLLAIAVCAGLTLMPVSIMAWRGGAVPRSRLVVITLTAVASVVLAIVLGYWRLLAPWSLG